MKTSLQKKSPRSGRPSRQAAGLLKEKILDSATELFFTQGYGITSVEAISLRAGISKRTFYARFKDKSEIFRAVVHRVIERLRPPDVSGLFEGTGEQVLRRLAPMILRAALTAEALALYRLVLAEADRFPELARATNSEGARQEAVRRITSLLQREVKTGRFAIDNISFAAEQFLQLLVSLPQRRALGLGQPMTANELEDWASATVDFFLKACRT